MFEDKVSLSSPAGEAMRTGSMVFVGVLLVETFGFWLLRLFLNEDLAGWKLLAVPIGFHLAEGLGLLAVMKSLAPERAKRVGVLVAWLLALPFACYSNLLFNFHLTW
jgi:hypothetical protein